MLSLAPAVRASAAVVYVDAAATGSQNGTSWANAYVDLRDALDPAPPGTEIRVAQGSYRPDGGSNVRTETFLLRNGVTILGGFAGSLMPDPGARDPGTYVSVLSGDLLAPGSNVGNSFHVVTGTGTNATAVLDGFAIVAGNADAGSPNDQGGGLIVAGGSPTIANCTFANNAGLVGGGVALTGSAAPAFINCRFESNWALNSGGAVFSLLANPTFTDCSFVSNAADSGGAAYSLLANTQFTDCLFDGNSAEFFGGGLFHSSGTIALTRTTFSSNVLLNDAALGNDGGAGYYHDAGTAVLSNCWFFDNLTSDDGGGAMIRGAGSVELSNCWFGGNTAGDNGGGVFVQTCPVICRSTQFSGNTAFDAGAGVAVVNASFALINSSVCKNSAFGAAGGAYGSNATLDIRNSLLWGNTAPGGVTQAGQVATVGPGPIINYSCVHYWNGALGGTGNGGWGPQLVDVDGPDDIPGTPDDDLRLSSFSPLVNRGDPMGLPPPADTDMEGEPRLMGCVLDIGADEFTLGETHSGDMDGSGVIDANDLQLFFDVVSGFGPESFRCVADMSADADVDAEDADMFLDAILGPPGLAASVGPEFEPARHPFP